MSERQWTGKRGKKAPPKSDDAVLSVLPHAQFQSVSAVFETMSAGVNTSGANAITQLVRGWGNYMNDTGDHFQPLQMFQDLHLCGPGSMGLLTDEHPLAPPTLRHIRSSPVQSRPFVFDHQPSYGNGEEDPLPPPIPLDPFQRSSSTPSSFRQRSVNSAFGTAGDRSAFSLPPQRVTASLCNARYSAFDPVRYYARQLEDMERTSIEVMDMTPDSGAAALAPSEDLNKSPTKRGAASRAARFLSDVRVLRRRRRRALGGRENPVEPSVTCEDDAASEQDTSSAAMMVDSTSITVITEPDYNPNETSMLSRSSEVSAIVKGALHDDSVDDVYSPPVNESDAEDTKEDTKPTGSQYQQLDSDVDEEDVQPYHHIETQLHSESPATVPSPSYQHFVDERPSASRNPKPYEHSLRIKLSNMDKPPAASSPSPTRMASGISFVSQTESPITARSSVTGSSSGHTTQATSVVSSIFGQSGLSTISETDREVMEANKEGKRRRNLVNFPTARKNESDLTSIHSSSTNSTTSHGYLALDGSPISLREGANVPAERFFTASPSSSGQSNGSVQRSQTNTSMFSRRSGSTTSPSTSESASGTHTSSSASSSREEPPTFVSYLDHLPEPLSMREATETSSPRATGKDREEREASPAEMVMGYSDVLFEEAKAPRQRKVICPTNQHARLEKFRTRPPRSPYKGTRSASTPPPRASPLFQHPLSPPRNIVDQPDTILLSRPNVRRTSNLSFSSRINDYSVFDDEEEVIMREAKFAMFDDMLDFTKRRTYDDRNVEITNFTTDASKEDSRSATAPLVTPEKVGP